MVEGQDEGRSEHAATDCCCDRAGCGGRGGGRGRKRAEHGVRRKAWVEEQRGGSMRSSEG
eukprot:80856-Rhodomonas_salina.4